MSPRTFRQTMKFSCDDCGAQYMIADEKIGPRGVKVRCKKCANVIILRPAKDGVRSMPPPGNGIHSSISVPPPPSPAPPPPPARGASAIGEDDEATQAMERAMPAARNGNVEVFGVSSELGLSAEFAANGFEVPPPTEAKPAVSFGIDVDLDLDREPAPRTPSSPFGGGSLRGAYGDHRPFGGAEALTRPAGLGRSVATDEAAESKTNVDLSPSASSDFGEVATRVAEVSIPPEARRPDVPREHNEPPTARANLLAELSLSNLAALEDEAAALDARLDRLRLDGGLQEGATVDTMDTVDRSEADFGSLRDPEPQAQFTVPVASDESEESAPTGLANLRGLDLGDDNPSIPLSVPQAPSTFSESTEDGAPPLAASGREPPSSGLAQAAASGGRASLPQAGESLDQEIGSAFEAVFGAGAGLVGERDPFDALVREADHAPSGGNGVNAKAEPAGDERKETRVFDADAMRRLQKEQDLALEKQLADEPAPAKEWYVAIEDEQVGPLALPDVQARWDAGDIDANSLGWKAGMGDWVAIRFIKELEGLSSGVARASTVRGEKPPKPALEKKKLDVYPELSALQDPAEVHEPSWRPNAASALASLAAQEEVSGPAVGGGELSARVSLPPDRPSIPGEKLTASMFGAKEQTALRAVTVLPKASELVSSMPLRDPVVARATPPWLLPAAIGGGATVVLALIIFLVVTLASPTPPPAPAPVQVAAATPPKEAPEPTAAAPAAASVQGAAQPSAPVPAAPAGGAEAAAPSPTQAPAAAAPAAGAAPEASREAGDLADRAEKRKPARGDRRDTASARSAPKREREPPPPPPPPVAEKKEHLEAEDLLAPQRKGSAPAAAPESDIPERLDDADVLRTLRKHKGDISACRDRQAKADPNLEGVMTVTFVVLKTGRTSQHAVSPDKFRSSVVGKCVLESVKGWKFPQFTGQPLPIDFPVMVKGG